MTNTAIEATTSWNGKNEIPVDISLPYDPLSPPSDTTFGCGAIGDFVKAWLVDRKNEDAVKQATDR